jgi:hypothetical protein
MKCRDCGQDILQKHPEMCPYCHSKNLISEEDTEKETQEIERLVKTGRYEDAALKYEKLDLWDKAKDCRMRAKKNRASLASLETGKVGTINLVCPHCNASQPVTTKSSEETCNHCGTTYIIPDQVRELIAFDNKT